MAEMTMQPRPRLDVGPEEGNCLSVGRNAGLRPGPDRYARPVSRSTGVLGSHTVLLVIRELEARGVDVESLLTSSGLTLDQLGRFEATVPGVSALKLLKSASQICPDPDLGLSSGLRCELGDLGLAGLMLRSSRDVHTAMDLFAQLQGQVATLMSARITVTPDGIAVEYVPELGAQTPRLVHDNFLVVALKLASEVLGPFAPAGVDVAAPEPKDRTGYVRYLGEKLRFGRPVSRVLIPTEVARRVLPNADDLVHRLVQPHVLRETVPDAQDLTGRVTQRLLANVDNGLPTIVEMARDLATTPRSLRRNLAREGSSYQCLVEEVKRAVTLSNLKDHPEISGVALASQLGYSEPPAFYRAFKRWTGVSFSEYRAGEQVSSP